MSAYVIACLLSVNDPDGFAEYAQVAGPTVEQYGGKFVVASNNIEVGDGSWSPVGMAVIEFENLERAKEWYNSPEYTKAKPLREKATDSGLVFLNTE